MECIQCTACIDACNTVMIKLNKPKGLIRYDSISGMAGKRGVRHFRSILYGVILLIFAVGLGFTLSKREPIRVEVLRGATPFQIDHDDIVTNHFRVHVYNRLDVPTPITIRLEPKHDGVTWVIPQLPTIPAGEQAIVDMFVRFPEEPMPKVSVTVNSKIGNKIITSHSEPFELVEPESDEGDD